jgi:hypothetical protein
MYLSSSSSVYNNANIYYHDSSIYNNNISINIGIYVSMIYSGGFSDASDETIFRRLRCAGISLVYFLFFFNIISFFSLPSECRHSSFKAHSNLRGVIIYIFICIHVYTFAETLEGYMRISVRFYVRRYIDICIYKLTYRNACKLCTVHIM